MSDDTYIVETPKGTERIDDSADTHDFNDAGGVEFYDADSQLVMAFAAGAWTRVRVELKRHL